MLAPPYGRRQAAAELRERLMRHITEERLPAGSPFFTDAELVAATGLSRSTVRRALGDLQRDGWIERRIGRGSSVGPRAAMPLPAGARPAGTPERAALRLAVLIYSVGDLARDWYTPLVLGGLDAVAGESGIAVELLGTRDRETDAISRRIVQTAPDVLACLTNNPREAFVLRDARRLGIPCIVTGTPHMRLGLPCIREDNVTAVRLAVAHLAGLGHRRIGLALQRTAEPWALERHESFEEAMRRLPAAPADAPTFWFPLEPSPDVLAGQAELLLGFIRRHRLTAMLAASALPAAALDALVRAGCLAVPADLSVVSFEQDGGRGASFGAAPPTWVDLGLAEIGRCLARLARELAAGRVPAAPVLVPCRLVAGRSTIRLS